MDVIEHIHARENNWGLVFYSVKTNLVIYYRLRSKDPTNNPVLYSLGKSLIRYGVPQKIKTDSHSILGASKFCKRVLRKTFISILLSDPDKHNQNR